MQRRGGEGLLPQALQFCESMGPCFPGLHIAGMYRMHVSLGCITGTATHTMRTPLGSTARFLFDLQSV
jgi:hypothetical protein